MVRTCCSPSYIIISVGCVLSVCEPFFTIQHHVEILTRIYHLTKVKMSLFTSEGVVFMLLVSVLSNVDQIELLKDMTISAPLLL